MNVLSFRGAPARVGTLLEPTVDARRERARESTLHVHHLGPSHRPTLNVERPSLLRRPCLPGVEGGFANRWGAGEGRVAPRSVTSTVGGHGDGIFVAIGRGVLGKAAAARGPLVKRRAPCGTV